MEFLCKSALALCVVAFLAETQATMFLRVWTQESVTVFPVYSQSDPDENDMVKFTISNKWFRSTVSTRVLNENGVTENNETLGILQFLLSDAMIFDSETGLQTGFKYQLSFKNTGDVMENDNDLKDIDEKERPLIKEFLKDWKDLIPTNNVTNDGSYLNIEAYIPQVTQNFFKIHFKYTEYKEVYHCNEVVQSLSRKTDLKTNVMDSKLQHIIKLKQTREIKPFGDCLYRFGQDIYHPFVAIADQPTPFDFQWSQTKNVNIFDTRWDAAYVTFNVVLKREVTLVFDLNDVRVICSGLQQSYNGFNSELCVTMEDVIGDQLKTYLANEVIDVEKCKVFKGIQIQVYDRLNDSQIADIKNGIEPKIKGESVKVNDVGQVNPLQLMLLCE